MALPNLGKSISWEFREGKRRERKNKDRNLGSFPWVSKA